MGLFVNIDVPDLEAAITFYTSAFDLRVDRRFGDAGVELIGFEVPIYLLPKGTGTPFAPHQSEGRNYQRHWTPVHLDITVPYLDGALEKALAAGASKESEIKTNSWGKIVLLADPFGHGFCLLEMSPAGYDAITSSRG